MIRPQLLDTVDRIVALRDREVALRERGRRLELIPTRREAANELFRKADGLRKARKALIERCGLD